MEITQHTLFLRLIIEVIWHRIHIGFRKWWSGHFVWSLKVWAAQSSKKLLSTYSHAAKAFSYTHFCPKQKHIELTNEWKSITSFKRDFFSTWLKLDYWTFDHQEAERLQHKHPMEDQFLITFSCDLSHRYLSWYLSSQATCLLWLHFMEGSWCRLYTHLSELVGNSCLLFYNGVGWSEPWDWAIPYYLCANKNKELKASTDPFTFESCD